MSEMKDTNTGDKNAEALQRKKDEKVSLDRHRRQRIWRTVLTAGAFTGVGAGGLAAILWFSKAFTDAGVAANFVVVNTLSLFVLLAIVAQACIYWAQRGIMNKQWDAMQEGLTETRKAMRYGQSAYITVKGLVLTRFNLGETVEVTIQFANSGITPAYDVELYTRSGMRKEPFVFSITEVGDAPEFQHGTFSRAILGPYGDVSKQVIQTVIPLTADSVERMKTKPYHVWGVVFYKDIFKRDRWTQFCYLTRGEKDFDVCSECNKTDDQE